MHSLDWLAHHMEHSDTFAQWLHQQFNYEFADQSLADWQHEFSQGQHNNDWTCLIAHEQGQLLGGAAFADNDLSDRPDLGPWLACVFVKPEARGRGLAAQLIEGICRHARARGVTRLYLHTHDQQAYYARRGWSVQERFDAWGKAQWLMSREL
ncbi:Acetyltransferase (GNAT) family protein [Pseudomonas asturiensis]|uniref:Acetyltransferase (GNAT) family protein n=1 Tax=Pseudomonas asturiensis TaxID=1190415 RepID=A0A1M7JE83_9PSED|nr:GNAT family N-acetyltransferase [Pseudomonas asturiensis]SHM51349.1 Acetyltransferase (GNAT) family protein [Pseudomonas asturiensis]